QISRSSPELSLTLGGTAAEILRRAFRIGRDLLLIHKFDALILGAGAAGLLFAIEASKRGRRVAVLERADRIGKKILISVGGRFNFATHHGRPKNYTPAIEHSANAASALSTPADFIVL